MDGPQPETLQGMFSDDKTGEIKIASAWPSEKIKSEILYSVGVMFFYPTSSDFPALSGKILKNVTNMSFALIYWLSCVEI